MPTGSKSGEGNCGGGAWRMRYASNRYRAGNDDGSRRTRQKAGPMAQKHRSPVARSGG